MKKLLSVLASALALLFTILVIASNVSAQVEYAQYHPSLSFRKVTDPVTCIYALHGEIRNSEAAADHDMKIVSASISGPEVEKDNIDISDLNGRILGPSESVTFVVYVTQGALYTLTVTGEWANKDYLQVTRSNSADVSGTCKDRWTPTPTVVVTATPSLTLTPEPTMTATPSATIDPSVTPTATVATPEPSVTPVTPEPSATPFTPEPTATDPAPQEEPLCHPNRIPAGEQWRGLAEQEPDVYVFALAGDNSIISQLFGGAPIKSLKIDFEWGIPVWELTFPNYSETRLGMRVNDAGKPGFDAIIDGCRPQELGVNPTPTSVPATSTGRCATCPPIRFCGQVPFASRYSDWFLGDLYVVVALEPFTGSQQITIETGVAYIAHGLTRAQVDAIDEELAEPLLIHEECSLPCENWGVVTLRDGRKAVWVGNGTNADELGVVLRSLDKSLGHFAGLARGSKLLSNFTAYTAVNKNRTYAYFYVDSLELVEDMQSTDNANYVARRAELDRLAGK